MTCGLTSICAEMARSLPTPLKAWQDYLRPYVKIGNPYDRASWGSYSRSTLLKSVGLAVLDESTTVPISPQTLQKLEQMLASTREKRQAKKDVKIAIVTGFSSIEKTRFLLELPALLSNELELQALYYVNFANASRLLSSETSQDTKSSGAPVAMRLIYQAVLFNTVHTKKDLAHLNFAAWSEYVHNEVGLNDIPDIKTAVRFLGGDPQKKCAIVVDQVDQLIEDTADLMKVSVDATRAHVMDKLTAMLGRISLNTQVFCFVTGTPPESFFHTDTPGADGYRTSIIDLDEYRFGTTGVESSRDLVLVPKDRERERNIQPRVE